MEEENVRGVISMNETYELSLLSHTDASWRSLGVKFLQLPTIDIFDTPSQDKLRSGVSFIREIEPTGRSVYVHCKAGRTRSATLVACYLMSKHGWTPEQAVDHIKERRPHVLLHRPQWDALRDYHQQIEREQEYEKGQQQR